MALIDTVKEYRGSFSEYDPKFQKRIGDAIMRAHRFVLTPSAASKVSHAIAAYPELLDTNGQFAIPPFETMWVEVPIRSLNEATVTPDSPEGTDSSVGLLFDKGDVFAYAANEQDKEPILLPFMYSLNRRVPLADQLELAEFLAVTRFQLDKFYWGHDIYSKLDPASQGALRRDHGCRLIPFKRKDIDLRWKGADLFTGAAGELRNIIGLLLALNQPSKYIVKTEEGHRRQMTAKGPRTYMSHSVIEFDLTRRSKRVLLRRPKGATPSREGTRWHEVRGHFCTNKDARESGCDHGGGEWWVETEPHKWECLECGGKRWWREYPEGRGTAALGMVSSQHKVVSNRTKEGA